MNLLIRFLWVMITAFLSRERRNPLEESVLRFRVLPNDLDLNFHMNNGRYLSMMDLGRMDLLGRAGLAKVALREKWYPLVGSATMRFIRPLAPFEKYDLRSRVLCWDEKWFYLEQKFERNGELKAMGLVKGLFRSKGRNIAPAEVAVMINLPAESPPMPESVRAWRAAEAALRG